MALVLVVEDDAALRSVIETALKDEGYEVVACSNGADALDVLKQHPVDAILLDLAMPVMDGYEFRRAQLRRREIRNVPVLVLSAGTRLSTLPPAFDAAAVLAKPFDVGTLLDVVGRLTKAAR